MKRQLTNFLSLIRWTNVLLYVFLQGLIFYYLAPVNTKAFIYMSLTFLFLGMAMNIHNNIIDKEIDQFKPGYIHFNSTFFFKLYVLFIFLSIVFLFLSTSKPYLVLTVIFSGILLWLYNKYFKKTPFYGNFLVALVIGIAVILPAWTAGLKNETHYLILVFLGLFAFLLNLNREIIKDMEDMAIDKRGGYRTLAILDLQTAERFLVLLSILEISFLVFVKSQIKTWAFWILVFSAILFLANSLKYVNSKNYQKAQFLIKILMLIGFILVLTGMNV